MRWRECSPTQSRQSGAAAVEFALILPLLLVLLIATIEFGYAYYTHITVTHAAREGVRVHALNSGDAVAVTRSAATRLRDVDTRMAVTRTPNPCVAGDPTRLTATYSHEFLTGFFGSTVTIEGIGEMRCGG